jgi:hypothetical protein
MTVTVNQTTEPVNLVWTNGDSNAQTFRFLTGNGNQAMDLTGITINAYAQGTLGNVVELQVQTPDPEDGTVTIHPPAQGLEPDVYDYDIQFHDGQTVNTWIHGRIQVRRDITP